MNAINLYALTRFDSIDKFYSYDQFVSSRTKQLHHDEREMSSLLSFSNLLFTNSVNPLIQSGYYFSYTIPQISKEFDLLRISENSVINIELKSEMIAEEKILKQLCQNKYYLSHLGKKVFLYCYVHATQQIFKLDVFGSLVATSITEIASNLGAQTKVYTSDIAQLFRVADYLVSPINTPDKFLAGEYFLTSQQEKFEKQFFEKVAQKEGPAFFALSGNAGTGKTLLLYDLAVKCSKYGQCCVIHCGILCESHQYLSTKLQNLQLVPIKDINDQYDFSRYSYVFADESQRIRKRQLDIITSATRRYGLTTIFSYDAVQTLSSREENDAIPQQIETLPLSARFILSDKIRTNKELVSFIRRLNRLSHPDVLSQYPSVSLAYANNQAEAIQLIRYYQAVGYTFINFTGSNYKTTAFDVYCGDINTHRVIGHEYDNVLMVLDKTFYYNENGEIRGKEHPNTNYIYTRMLLQGLTRVREKLALVVVDNTDLFDNLFHIVHA